MEHLGPAHVCRKLHILQPGWWYGPVVEARVVPVHLPYSPSRVTDKAATAMVYQVTATASEDVKHVEDVECITIMAGLIYTGADDGYIKAWSPSLELIRCWKAHEYVVNDLAGDESNNVLYSCSLEGEIKKWSMDRVVKDPVCMATAIQTGPACGVEAGGYGSAEHLPVTVKCLVVRADKLYSGDELGDMCTWTTDLQLEAKLEFYTDIWSMAINKDADAVYVAKDNDIIIGDLTRVNTLEQFKGTPQVMGNIAGRAPVVLLDGEGHHVACLDKAGFKINLFKRESKSYEKEQVLEGHDMIVNTLAVTDSLLASSGWDAKVNVWNYSVGDSASKVGEVMLDCYINKMAVDKDGSFYAGGKGGHLVRIQDV